MVHRYHVISVFIISAALAVLCFGPASDMVQPTRFLEAEGEQESVGEQVPGMLEFYYMQRQYGNPGIDIQRKIFQVYEELRDREQFSVRKPAYANKWINMGPTNLGGRMRAVVFDPSNTNVIYAGGAMGGVWKSTNGGENWFPLTDDLPALAIGALAIDPDNPNRIFAGTGEPVRQFSRASGAPSYNGIGILRSEDAGATWEKLPWPFSSSAVHRIVLHPQSADTMLVATMQNLWKTTNGGQTWLNAQSGVITDVVYKPDNPATVFVAIGNDMGGSNGIYRSDAGGNRFTFRRLSNNFPAGDSCGRILLAVSPKKPNRLYVAVALNYRLRFSQGADPDADFFMFLVSNDAGETWERKLNAVNPKITNGQAFYDFALAVDPDNPDFVMLGGLTWYRSTNGGNSFMQVTNPHVVHVDQHAIAFKPDDTNTIMIGNDGGLYISHSRGATWEAKNSNLVTIQYYTCGYDPTNPERLVGGTQDNGTQRQGSPGSTMWSILNGGDGGYFAIDPKDNRIMYTTISVHMAPYRTLNGGLNWTRMESGLNGGTDNDRFNWMKPIALHPLDESRLFMASQYVYRMMQANSATFPSWSIISPDLTRRRSSESVISNFTIPATDANRMYTVSGDGKAFISRNVLAVDPNWTDISTGLPNRWLTDVETDWTNPDIAYVTASGFGTGHVFKTTNAGQSWTDISGNFPDIPVNAVVLSRTDADVLFLATDLGVWVTADGGSTWERFGVGLPNVVVYDIALKPDNTLIAGTHGRGMWTASAILGVEDQRPAPATLALEANFPNPFGPASVSGETVTALAYATNQRTDIRLSVYDIRGRLVRELVRGTVEPGKHTALFDGSALPAGTYLAVLDADGVRKVRRMLLLK